MASIENRSRIQVTVKNRDDLTKQFAYSAGKAIQEYVQELRAKGLKPSLTRLNGLPLGSIALSASTLRATAALATLLSSQKIPSEFVPGVSDQEQGWSPPHNDGMLFLWRT